MLRREIDQKYQDQHKQMEKDYLDIIDLGLPSQHSVLQVGKSIDDFNLAHGQLWQNHEAELIASGFMEPALPPELPRDLAAEIDELKQEIDKLKVK